MASFDETIILAGSTSSSSSSDTELDTFLYSKTSKSKDPLKKKAFETQVKMRDTLKNKTKDPHKEPKVEEQNYGKKQHWDFVTTNSHLH